MNDSDFKKYKKAVLSHDAQSDNMHMV